MASDDLRQGLQQKGWAKTKQRIDDPRSFSLFLMATAHQVGKPIGRKSDLVEKIVPRKAEEANPNSLSGKYGLGQFPLHCDTCQWPIPCRFILLGCVNSGPQPTPTFLLDRTKVSLSPTEQRLATSSVFLIRNGRKSFYSTILSPRRNFMRYDPACMEAIDEKGSKAIQLYDHPIRQSLVQRITLNIGDVLAIDNWRILHGRGKCPDTISDRALLRVYVR